MRLIDRYTIRPPSASVVRKALSAVLANIELHNDTLFASGSLKHVTHQGLSFSDLEVNAETLMIAARDLHQEAVRQAASFRKCRNALLPIHTLPMELFSRILIESLDHLDPKKWKIDRLQTLASVAASWWQIVKETPLLWAVADSRQPNFHLALRKSRHVPLTIICIPSDTQDQKYSHFVSLVTRASSRWKELNVGAMHPEQLIPLLEAPIPQLKILRISLENESVVGPRLVQPSNLTTVDICRVNIPWDCLALPTLRSLALAHTSSLSSAALLLVLASTPYLETLDLSNIEWNEATSVHSFVMPTEPIVLNDLRRLTAVLVPSDLVLNLIKGIQADNLSCLRAAPSGAGQIGILNALTDTDHGRSIILNPIIATHSKLLTISISSSGIVLGPDKAVWRHTTRDESSLTQVSLVGDRVDETISCLITNRPFDTLQAPPIRFSITGDPMQMFGDTYPSVLGTLPTLTDLRVCAWINPLPFIRYLSEHQPTASEARTWPCRNLDFLRVEIEDVPEGDEIADERRMELADALANLCIARRGAVDAGDASDAGLPPPRVPTIRGINNEGVILAFDEISKIFV